MKSSAAVPDTSRPTMPRWKTRSGDCVPSIACVVLYDAHSIRSRVSRLFDGVLPHLNIGTNNGATCDPTLTASIESVCDKSSFTRVTNGRFRGGWTTRHYGNPARGIHAVQMELACRGYLAEPAEPFTSNNWPPAYDAQATALRTTLDSSFRPASPSPTREIPMTSPTRIDKSRIIRAPRGHAALCKELAHRSAAAHADEQSRPGCRRAAARSSWSTAASVVPPATGSATTPSSPR